MKKIVWITLLLFLAGAAASADDRTYRISVSQFVEHPALDAVLKGFQDYMSEKKIKVDYSLTTLRRIWRRPARSQHRSWVKNRI